MIIFFQIFGKFDTIPLLDNIVDVLIFLLVEFLIIWAYAFEKKKIIDLKLRNDRGFEQWQRPRDIPCGGC